MQAKKRYLVNVERTCLTRWEVEAENAGEAAALVRQGHGVPVDAGEEASGTEICEVQEFARTGTPPEASAASRRPLTVLLATDGSAGAATAGHLLATLPLPAGSRVVVVSAMPASGWLAAPEQPDFAEKAGAAALRTAEEAATSLRARGFTVAARGSRQKPAAAILEAARSAEAALIVVGSHGMDPIEHFLIGSVSERVARHASCSVLVARGAALRRAIVAVDGTEASRQALEALARLPLPAEMEWVIVHVLGPLDLPPPAPPDAGVSWGPLLDEWEQQRRARAERIVQEAQAALRRAGREAGTQILLGDPVESLIAATREREADLLIVGSANRSAVGRLLLGSVSARVLGHAPCSVLVARATVGSREEAEKGG